MIKNSYNIYMSMYIDTYKIGLRNRGINDSGLILILELPVILITYIFEFSIPLAMITVIGSVLVFYGIYYLISEIYNRSISRKILDIFGLDSGSKDDLIKLFKNKIEELKKIDSKHNIQRVIYLKKAITYLDKSKDEEID